MNIGHWVIAKLVRHRTLDPEFAGSNPAYPIVGGSVVVLRRFYFCPNYLVDVGITLEMN